MRAGSNEWYLQKHKDNSKARAKLSFRERLLVILSLELGEIKDTHPALYDIVKNEFPDISDRDTLDTARSIKLFKKIFKESSTKALELSYKLDGSFDNLINEPDYERIAEELEGVK